MQFKLSDGIGGGCLAFTPPTTKSCSGSVIRPLLLVADAGNDAVHLVDVVARTHVGYLAFPGSIAGPRGVAASGTSPLVAVSAWKSYSSGEHVVVAYKGDGVGWEVVRVIGGGFRAPGDGDGQLSMPFGLRFSGDGSVICVADRFNRRASVFRVGDGGFVRHITTGLTCPMDVEEVEGGWLVVCWSSHVVELAGGGGGRRGHRLGKVGGGWGMEDGEFAHPSALAVVPGLGLAVRQGGGTGCLQVFATRDAIAMASMSPLRVAWVVGVVRSVLRQYHAPHFPGG
jgi:hypothetical protein